MADSLTADAHRHLVLVRCTVPGCRRQTFFPVQALMGPVCPTVHGGITPDKLAAHLMSFMPPRGCKCVSCVAHRKQTQQEA